MSDPQNHVDPSEKDPIYQPQQPTPKSEMSIIAEQIRKAQYPLDNCDQIRLLARAVMLQAKHGIDPEYTDAAINFDMEMQRATFQLSLILGKLRSIRDRVDLLKIKEEREQRFFRRAKALKEAKVRKVNPGDATSITMEEARAMLKGLDEKQISNLLELIKKPEGNSK